MQNKGAGLDEKRRSITFTSAAQLRTLAVAGLTLLLGARAQAQGILTVTPGRTATTVAGTGTVGYTGNGNSAISATLATPAAVAYDASGNLFIADAANHVIREVLAASGSITTVAGAGVAGFGGDGGPATSAFLDTPTGIAVDGSGNLYIADSHNQRIRKVIGTTITTIAGTGTAGFSGDGSAATSAALNLPSAVAVDPSGNVYIADTNNQRIRKITGATISTIAGTGEQSYTGDGGAATSATLDSPTGIAVDASGNLYIADRHNQRIRQVSGGAISTVAGSGAPDFAGSFNGDGAPATSATLARPTGVAVDSAGHVYIADTNNQRVREVAGAAISTIAGTSEQGFVADGGTATSTVLNAPRGVAADSAGNVAVSEAPGERVRALLLPVVDFGNQLVGSPSSTQTFVLSNSGTASLTVSSVSFTGPFAQASGGTCPGPPTTLSPGASCSLKVLFFPGAVGRGSGSVVISGTGVVPQTVLLIGTGVPVTPTKLVYTSIPPSPITAGGNARTVQIALEDGAGNIATSNSGTAMGLTVTGPSSYSQIYSATTTNGVATFNLSSVPLTVAGNYTYTAASGSLTPAIVAESVNPGSAAFFSVTGLTTFTAPQISGTATVKAQDTYGNVATSFSGTVTLSSSDTLASFSPSSYTYTSGDTGVHTFTVTFNTAGTQTLTATSGALTGSEVGIQVEDSIWVLNTDGTLVRTTDAGSQTTTAGTSSGAAIYGALAFDNSGDLWMVTNANSIVQEYSKAGVAIPVSGSGAAGVNTPVSLFVDGLGQVWVANSNNSVSVLNNSGAPISPRTGYQAGSLSTPSAIIVDSAGSVWVTNRSGNSFTKIFGAAAPVETPIVTGTANNQLGVRP